MTFGQSLLAVAAAVVVATAGVAAAAYSVWQMHDGEYGSALRWWLAAMALYWLIWQIPFALWF